MRVSLVNIQLLEGNNIVAPLGLLYVASVLEKHGHTVQAFDVDPEVYNLIDEIKDFKPDVIGLSFLTPEYIRAQKTAKRLKEELPDAVHIAGGVHATIMPTETLEEFGLDIIVVGEGEETIVDLCEKLEKGESIDDVRGIVHKKDGQVVTNERREMIKDLDTVPFPSRHLLNFNVYLTPPGVIRGYAKSKILTMMTSRGCPYACHYCGSHNLFGRKMRRRSVDNVIAEIDHLIERYDINGLYFCDDLFTRDHDWVREFCQKVKDRGIVWACQSRVDTINEELMRDMKAAGCIQIDFGVENGSPRVLKALNKTIKIPDAKKVFKMAKRVKIRALATFMIGNPEETLEDLQQTFDLAKELDADYTIFYYTTPYPGTKVYEMARENEWIPKDAYFSEAWSHRQQEVPLMEINFTGVELMKHRSKMQNHFFVKNYFVWNNLGFYSELFLTMLKHPAVLYQMITTLIRTKRSEVIGELLFKQYNLDKYEWFDKQRDF
ncbi:MAG: radical SAM protein [Candidatus Hydrothermarchaeaceae archaeon]